MHTVGGMTAPSQPVPLHIVPFFFTENCSHPFHKPDT